MVNHVSIEDRIVSKSIYPYPEKEFTTTFSVIIFSHEINDSTEVQVIWNDMEISLLVWRMLNFQKKSRIVSTLTICTFFASKWIFKGEGLHLLRYVYEIYFETNVVSQVWLTLTVPKKFFQRMFFQRTCLNDYVKFLLQQKEIDTDWYFSQWKICILK